MKRGLRYLPLAIAFLLSPTLAVAQGSITGTVRDTSGAVLPGVTVEAASPALIEKVRTVVTDGSGQYRIVDLRPGTYTVTFTLAGFNTVKRDGIELTGSFTASVNAELRVGALEETITVTGESPVVDVQSVRQQQVINKEVIDTIPSGRTHFSIAELIPGVNTTNTTDVGGSNAVALVQMTAHGSRVYNAFNSSAVITLNNNFATWQRPQAILQARFAKVGVRAQAPATDAGGPLWRGAYTAAQAARGEATFTSMCARCHRDDLTGGPSGGARAPALAGDAFFARWDSTSVNRLFRTIRDTMPRGGAGALSDEAAVELVAFILRYNGFPAGETELATQPALLDKLPITPKPGAPKPVTNFSLVDVTGCLSKAANGRWIVAGDKDERFRLVGAAPFKVDAHAGERVRVSGLIRRDPTEILLTVTAVTPAGTPCGT